ncbi:MAG: flagellar biosynthesis anti-sigma factor FlgM [Methylobacter sp.]|nr:MAG: flagellar biosynthesis anti-sigma factor FlgM [Methylobacter sp.]
MAIEITGRISGPSFVKSPPKPDVDGENGEQKVTVTNTEKHDSIALTAATQEIKKALGSPSASPVDSDRVNSVKKALADGNYPIDAKQTAKKLIQFEKLISKENST